MTDLNGTTCEVSELQPGECISWEQKKKEYKKITGNEELVARIWKETDSLAYMYIWHLLLSF